MLPDGTWNEERIRYFFAEEDVMDILKIQTSRRNESDFVAWHPEKRGMFTVRSAYWLAFDVANRGQQWGASSRRPDGERPCWKLIWNSRVPPKVKLLIWRICRNGLATQKNMVSRRMATTSLCQICGWENEDTFHIFVRCPQDRALWLAMKEDWELPEDDLLQPTGKEWLLQVLTTIPEPQRGRTMLVLWRIWHNHNEMTV
jgi:hypothetical protein